MLLHYHYLLKNINILSKHTNKRVMTRKLAICNGYLVCFQVAAELEQRKENFKKEMDFVVANVVSLSTRYTVNEKSSITFLGYVFSGSGFKLLLIIRMMKISENL
jgi:uncharacterized CHY-type Zn-finger protein